MVITITICHVALNDYNFHTPHIILFTKQSYIYICYPPIFNQFCISHQMIRKWNLILLMIFFFFFCHEIQIGISIYICIFFLNCWICIQWYNSEGNSGHFLFFSFSWLRFKKTIFFFLKVESGWWYYPPDTPTITWYLTYHQSPVIQYFKNKYPQR